MYRQWEGDARWSRHNATGFEVPPNEDGGIGIWKAHPVAWFVRSYHNIDKVSRQFILSVTEMKGAFKKDRTPWIL